MACIHPREFKALLLDICSALSDLSAQGVRIEFNINVNHDLHQAVIEKFVVLQEVKLEH